MFDGNRITLRSAVRTPPPEHRRRGSLRFLHGLRTCALEDDRSWPTARGGRVSDAQLISRNRIAARLRGSYKVGKGRPFDLHRERLVCFVCGEGAEIAEAAVHDFFAFFGTRLFPIVRRHLRQISARYDNRKAATGIENLHSLYIGSESVSLVSAFAIRDRHDGPHA